MVVTFTLPLWYTRQTRSPWNNPNITTILLIILIYQILRVSVHCIKHGKHQIDILSQIKYIALFISKYALHFFSRIYKRLLQKSLHFQTLVILVNLVRSQFPFVFSSFSSSLALPPLFPLFLCFPLSLLLFSLSHSFSISVKICSSET